MPDQTDAEVLPEGPTEGLATYIPPEGPTELDPAYVNAGYRTTRYGMRGGNFVPIGTRVQRLVPLPLHVAQERRRQAIRDIKYEIAQVMRNLRSIQDEPLASSEWRTVTLEPGEEPLEGDRRAW